MRVIIWNRSFKSVPNGEGGKDDVDSEDYETHATVLDKLLAWEKKLYDEVKVHLSLINMFLLFSADAIFLVLLLIMLLNLRR